MKEKFNRNGQGSIREIADNHHNNNDLVRKELEITKSWLKKISYSQQQELASKKNGNNNIRLTATENDLEKESLIFIPSSSSEYLAKKDE